MKEDKRKWVIGGRERQFGKGRGLGGQNDRRTEESSRR